MRKTIIIFLSLLLIALSGCTPKGKGVIEERNVAEPMIVQDIGENNIFNIDASSELEYETFYDYNAGFSIPYPKGWEINEHSSNFTTITGPDAQITISHNLMTDPMTGDYKNFKDSYKATIKNELIGLDGDVWQRRDSQTISTLRVVSEDPLLIAETYDDLKVSNDVNDYISGEYCENRYYMSFGNINSLISIVGKSQEDYQILDYMVANIKTVPVKYESSISVDGLTLPITFKKKTVELGGFEGTSYTPETNDAYSGCFVQVYSGNIDLREEALDAMFQNAFNQAFDNGYNYGENLLGSKLFDNDEISINATISTEALYSDVKTSTAYVLDIYQDTNRTIVIGYPVAKTTLMQELAAKQ